MTMPYGGGGGYSYTPQALSGMAGQLRQGSQALDSALGVAVDAVDAGASSGAVGQALAGMMRMATGTASVISSTADKVHSASGAYDDIENTHAGQMRLNDRHDAGN